MFLSVSTLFFPQYLEAKSTRIKTAEALAKTIFQNIFEIMGMPSTEMKKRKALVKLFDKHADVPIIARAVLGSPWRQLNKGDRSNFIKAFRQYLAKKYTAQFSEFLGAKMMIEKSRDSGGKAGIMVETRLLMPGSSPIKVGWQVSDASGVFKMVDVKIEGVSLLTTERGEIRNQLSKEGGSVSRLAQALLDY
jgi:phospholipid transport system substrate-binding protein